MNDQPITEAVRGCPGRWMLLRCALLGHRPGPVQFTSVRAEGCEFRAVTLCDRCGLPLWMWS